MCGGGGCSAIFHQCEYYTFRYEAPSVIKCPGVSHKLKVCVNLISRRWRARETKRNSTRIIPCDCKVTMWGPAQQFPTNANIIINFNMKLQVYKVLWSFSLGPLLVPAQKGGNWEQSWMISRPASLPLNYVCGLAVSADQCPSHHLLEVQRDYL